MIFLFKKPPIGMFYMRNLVSSWFGLILIRRNSRNFLILRNERELNCEKEAHRAEANR